MTPVEYDIAIIGAGPAGSTAAYHLARGGLRVALLDKAAFPRDKTCGDGLTPRALHALETLGLLQPVADLAFHCRAITLRQSDAIEFQLTLTQLDDFPQQILVLPRLQLDDLLRQHAVAAGAHFNAEAKVRSLTRAPDGVVHVHLAGRETPLTCRLAIIATGANAKLLNDLELLRGKPPVNLAARAYFENVAGLSDTIVLFFDDVALPGYGWVFPTSPTSANVGYGMFFESSIPPASRLREMLQQHPYLQRILKDAQQVGPIKGYPLRTDFSPKHSGNDWLLVVGEAAGLVNPITGEGIDYALESSELAAAAILNGWRDGRPTAAIAPKYRAALSQRFQSQFILNRLVRWLYFREGALPRFLQRAQQRPALRQMIVDTCFGTANPAILLSPRGLWAVFGP